MPASRRGDQRPTVIEQLRKDNAELRARLEEAEETIHAIQQGAVDAFVLQDSGEHRVYTLAGADRPYRLFVEQMQQGAATLHGDGTIVYCNQQLADLLGVPHARLVGAELADFVAPEDRPHFGELLRQGWAESGEGEARLTSGGGDRVPAYFTFRVLPQDCGAMIGVIITDLRTQKHYEQLAAAKEALQEADRRKNEFLAILAHELRNPLAPICSAVSILRRDGEETPAIRDTCVMLERQVGQMVRLVDDLVDVSRITQNKIELRRERIDLASVVDQAVESVRPLLLRMHDELTVKLPPAPVTLHADRARLVQVFANLLDNACKFSPEGGRISLSAEVHPAEPAEVVVRVRDNGIGIPPDQLPRIFDMFAQLDTSLERTRSGLGIGLTLVSKLVGMHEGRIETQSDGPGLGSEFVVRLPILTGEAAESRPETTTEATTRSYRILVVDDNRDSAESMALLLKSMGHETRTAFGGMEALEAIEASRPDVVLLDIGMPGLNGYDTCRRIREQPWAKEMVLIAQTGWGQDEDRQRTREAGFDGHLVKPVDADDFVKTVNKLSHRGSND